MLEPIKTVSENSNITRVVTEGKPVPRMRTIQECADYLQSQDPETRIKYYTLRRWVLEGKIPCVPIGNRKFVNLDLLLDIVSGKTPWPEQKKGLKILPSRGR